MLDVRADDLWKLLKYDVSDALSKPSLTMEEKRNLIWNNQSFESSEYKLFLTPMPDDLQDKQITNLRVFVDGLFPENRTVATVDVVFQIFSHFKLNQLNDYTMRQTKILKILLTCLNGADINGLGLLFFNRQESLRNNAMFGMTNNRNYNGYVLTMSTKCGGR